MKDRSPILLQFQPNPQSDIGDAAETAGDVIEDVAETASDTAQAAADLVADAVDR